MVRPRNILIELFPPGTITPEQASNALRKADGNLEQAKAILEASPSNVKNNVSIVTAEAKPKQQEAGSENSIANTNNTNNETRLPPRFVASVNNLSDRQYCCVWHVEVFEDGYRPEVARALLARVARHVNPVLRERGWRVKRLIESASRSFLGCCTTNGRGDADAASTNIQLNLRQEPNKHCRQFRTFEQVMGVMLHEITHTSIGLEDIHPPAFYALLDEIRIQYSTLLKNGEVEKETDTYGCDNAFVTQSGHVSTVGQAASGIVPQHGEIPLFDSNEECGAKKRRRRRWRKGGSRKRSAGQAMGTRALQQQEKRRPLLKGAKMIDKRTKEGKLTMAQQATIPARELADRAALARFGGGVTARKEEDDDQVGGKEGGGGDRAESSSDASRADDRSDDEDSISSHDEGCTCRNCEWEQMLESALTTKTSAVVEEKKQSE